MKDKKTKLTLSGIAKRSIQNIEIAKTQSKNSVVIEKKTTRFANKSPLNTSTSNKRFNQNTKFKEFKLNKILFINQLFEKVLLK